MNKVFTWILEKRRSDKGLLETGTIFVEKGKGRSKEEMRMRTKETEFRRNV